jgi:hypothetical protein
MSDTETPADETPTPTDAKLTPAETSITPTTGDAELDGVDPDEAADEEDDADEE